MYASRLLRLGYSAIATAALAFASGPAWAQHGHSGGHHEGGGGGHHEGGGRGDWSGYRGGWGGGYGYGGYGGYGWGGYGWGGYGVYPRLWGWGGYYPNRGYYYGGYPYYGDNYYGDNYSSAPSYGYSAPSMTTSRIPQNAVLLRVQVPENAQVFLDDQKTSQTGPVREFVTPPLNPGQPFSYDVKARWTENGQEVVRDKRVTFHAGDRLTVDMTAPDNARTTQPIAPAPAVNDANIVP